MSPEYLFRHLGEAIAIITYKIHLIRTGGTGSGDTGGTKKYTGRKDVPLSHEGRNALLELVRGYEYPKADIVFTSPLSRCVQTAGIIYPETYTVGEEGLIDMSLGAFEGKTFDGLKDDRDFLAWLDDSSQNPPPGGEKSGDFTRRVLEAVNRIFMRMMNERLTSAAAVTHGGVIMTILASIGLPKLPLHHWAVDNGCGYTILMTPQMWMRDRACEVFSAIPGKTGR